MESVEIEVATGTTLVTELTTALRHFCAGHPVAPTTPTVTGPPGTAVTTCCRRL
jgi:hypothetical protein